MECPRCHEPAPLAALACGVCSAPLRLREEPPPAALDRPLDLDRRRHDRAALTPAPLAVRPLAPCDEAAGTPLEVDLDLEPDRDLRPAPHPALRTEDDGSWEGLAPAPLPALETESERTPVPASLGVRALAALVDVLLVAIATAPPVLLAAWSLPGPVDVTALMPAALVLAALVAVAYGALLLGLTGATPGGRLVGLAVLDGEGQAPGMGRAAARAALAVLGTFALGAGLWPALFTDSRRTLHDRVAGTFVVRAP